MVEASSSAGSVEGRPTFDAKVGGAELCWGLLRRREACGGGKGRMDAFFRPLVLVSMRRNGSRAQLNPLHSFVGAMTTSCLGEGCATIVLRSPCDFCSIVKILLDEGILCSGAWDMD